MPKKKNGFIPEVEVDDVKPVSVSIFVSEKERLQNLLQQLKDLKVNSISDLENRIAGAE